MSNLTPRGTIKGVIRSGGGGGVTDYDQLTGRPSINNELVTGDKGGHDYGLMNSNDIRITKIVDLTYGTNYDLEFPDDHVYITNQIFQPAGVSSNGTKGLVPRPSAGDTGKILSNEGWINPPESYTPPNYSTAEQKIGQKWIDGKDLYFKVIYYSYSTLSSGSTYIIDTINNINLKKVEGVIIEESTGYTYYLPYAQSAGSSIYYYDNDLIISIGSGTSFASGRIELAIYYTKN